jgi:hypothetical protein
MPMVRVARLLSLRIDSGRAIVNLSPGDHLVTEEQLQRIVGAGLGQRLTSRGDCFRNLPAGDDAPLRQNAAVTP